ncbi:MAG: hypothetical protein M0T84_17160 [Betaproteobacteria bacterium]|nr:hypothetical protein [Betaproteobacteria bacterium]
MIDIKSMANWVVYAALAVIGWLARALWYAVKELRTDLARLREELPEKYVLKDDFREDMKEIKAMLGRIFDRLDGKADK